MASAPTDLQALAQKLLSGDFDINLLDQIVGAAYDPISPHRAQANKALMQLQESPELWRMADTIIEQSQNPNSRFFGLQVLDDAIKIRYAENEFCVGNFHWLLERCVGIAQHSLITWLTFFYSFNVIE